MPPTSLLEFYRFHDDSDNSTSPQLGYEHKKEVEVIYTNDTTFHYYSDRTEGMKSTVIDNLCRKEHIVAAIGERIDAIFNSSSQAESSHEKTHS